MTKSSAVAAAIVATLWAAVPSTAQEAAQAKTLFRQRCGACHQNDTTRDGVGPHLQGVIGRMAGSVEGFNYSPALSSKPILARQQRLPH
jgi:cytochrome c